MARRPSFFKILIFDFLTRLRIPPAFIKNLETNLIKKLPQKFVLETSARRLWHVNVEKVDNNLYFRKGWKQFVQQNSLHSGDLLVFKYHGNLKFELEIYGRNCCKKSVEMLEMYRKQEQKTCEAMSGRRRSDRNVRTKILQNLNNVRKERGSGSRMSNEWFNGKAGEDDDVIEISDSGDDETDEESLPDRGEHLKKTSGLETAENFTSSYPFFKVTMSRSYVHNAYMNIPKRFIRANGLECRGKNVKLKVSNKTWSVKMTNQQRFARLCGGWSDFVQDNSLQEDDDCLFELIDIIDDISFRVTIFRNIS